VLSVSFCGGGGDGVSILDPSWNQASENIQDRSCFLLQASPFGTANTPLLKNSSLRITTCYLKWLWFTVLGLISWNYLKKRNRTLTTYSIKFLVHNNMKHFDVIRIPEETKEELLKQKGHRTWEVFLKEVASKEKLVAWLSINEYLIEQASLHERSRIKFKKNVVLYLKELEKRGSLRRRESLIIFKWKDKFYEKIISHVLREERKRIFYNDSTQRVQLITDPKQETLEKLNH